MTIQAFIEKAIEGGWRMKYIQQPQAYGNGLTRYIQREWSGAEILLDPDAWRAVGKVKGWSEDIDLGIHGTKPSLIGYTMYMHQMLDALIEGKDIKTFLETL